MEDEFEFVWRDEWNNCKNRIKDGSVKKKERGYTSGVTPLHESSASS
jgi:hypothetical protein